MSGTELARMWNDWYPRLKVIFIAGYSEELLASQGVLLPGVAYVPKPFTADQLAARVREMLDDERDHGA